MHEEEWYVRLRDCRALVELSMDGVRVDQEAGWMEELMSSTLATLSACETY